MQLTGTKANQVDVQPIQEARRVDIFQSQGFDMSHSSWDWGWVQGGHSSFAASSGSQEACRNWASMCFGFHRQTECPDVWVSSSVLSSSGWSSEPCRGRKFCWRSKEYEASTAWARKQRKWVKGCSNLLDMLRIVEVWADCALWILWVWGSKTVFE